MECRIAALSYLLGRLANYIPIFTKTLYKGGQFANIQVQYPSGFHDSGSYFNGIGSNLL